MLGLKAFVECAAHQPKSFLQSARAGPHALRSHNWPTPEVGLAGLPALAQLSARSATSRPPPLPPPSPQPSSDATNIDLFLDGVSAPVCPTVTMTLKASGVSTTVTYEQCRKNGVPICVSARSLNKSRGGMRGQCWGVQAGKIVESTEWLDARCAAGPEPGERQSRPVMLTGTRA